MFLFTNPTLTPTACPHQAGPHRLSQGAGLLSHHLLCEQTAPSPALVFLLGHTGLAGAASRLRGLSAGPGQAHCSEPVAEQMVRACFQELGLLSFQPWTSPGGLCCLR